MDRFTCPEGRAYRFDRPLRFELQHGEPLDGPVVKGDNDGKAVSYVLPPEPGEDPKGPLFFVPTPLGMYSVRRQPKPLLVGCSATLPGAVLPPPLRFRKLMDVMLPIEDHEADVPELRKCGELWVLHTIEEILAETFDELCQEVLACKDLQGSDFTNPSAGQYAAGGRELDMDFTPDDEYTYAAAMALKMLSKTSKDPNTRLFAWLLLTHLRATYLPFDQVCPVIPMARMVAVALEAWTTHDFRQHLEAFGAYNLLRPDMDPPRDAPTEGRPYDHIEPLNFRVSLKQLLEEPRADLITADDCNHQLASHAPAYVYLEDLTELIQEKIREMASDMVSKGTSGTTGGPSSTGVVHHDGLDFEIVCTLAQA